MTRARLSPGGVLGAGEAGWRRSLRDTLGDDLYAVAVELAACVPDRHDADVLLALLAACLDAAARGSTRLPIGDAAGGPLASALAALAVPPEVAARARDLLAAAPTARGAAGALIGGPDDYRPLIVDGDALCTQRLRAHEHAVGRVLRDRLERSPLPYDDAAVGAALDDVLARAPRDPTGRPITLSAEQQRAIVVAAHQALTVVSGGPGTGKTSIVVSLLRLLLRLDVAPGAIALAAPTGKAAHRMAESMATYLETISPRAPADERLRAERPEPSTLHRLLGYSQAQERFSRHAGNPLPHDVVIVDEASMIDLGLMAALARAVRPGARLVLLGDADQLPSVDAGAVLRDLMPARPGAPPRPWDARVPRPAVVVTGAASPAAAAEGTTEAQDLRACGAVRLHTSYRQDAADPLGRAIYEVSRSIKDGVTPPVIPDAGPGAHLTGRATAAAVRFEAVELLEAPRAERDALLESWWRERVLGGPSEGRPAGAGGTGGEAAREPALLEVRRLAAGGFSPDERAALDAIDRQFQAARVLCLTRRAAAAVNTAMARRLRELVPLRAGGMAQGRERFLPGTPVLMTRNDYELGLFNGDHGFALRVQRDGEARPRLRLVFRVKDTYEVFDAGALGEHVEPCWAMTVHKAQGSEFSHVALVLPSDAELASGGDAAALACREVVYTAVTRAKKSVTVLGTAAALERAVARTLERWSALGAASHWSG